MGIPGSFHTWTLDLLPSLQWNISRSWGPYFPSQPLGMHSTGDCLKAGQREQQRKEKPTGGLSTRLRSEGQLRMDLLEERHTERPPCPRENVNWLIISRWRAKYLPKEYLGLKEWTTGLEHIFQLHALTSPWERDHSTPNKDCYLS